MGQRRALTMKKAMAYRRASRPDKSKILDELVELIADGTTTTPDATTAGKRLAPMLATVVPPFALRRDHPQRRRCRAVDLDQCGLSRSSPHVGTGQALPSGAHPRPIRASRQRVTKGVEEFARPLLANRQRVIAV
jgi:hypothetical protein